MTTLKRLIAIPSDQETLWKIICAEKKILKGQLFICPGEIPKKFAFVKSGLFRYYYLDIEGKESTKAFIESGSFIASYSAMITGGPSLLYIEALEDSIIYEVQFQDWLALRQQHKCWNELLVYMLEKAFVIKETREREFLQLDAEQRYQNFRKNFPNLESRVRQHHIASYLGITAVSLSRLRKQHALT